MPYTIGDLIKQHLSRRHGLSQARLAVGVSVDDAVITRICRGTRKPSRALLLRIIQWMQDNDILGSVDEANALLAAGGLVDLDIDIPAESALLARLSDVVSGQAITVTQIRANTDVETRKTAVTDERSTNWIAVCEQYIRSGELHALSQLLEEALPQNTQATVLFYRGRIAALEARYMQAAQHFQAAATAARVEGQSELHHRSLVWIAYCQNMLGNYRLARTLAERVANVVPIESPTYAEVLFVYGIIAADGDSLSKAFDLLEQARDMALLLSHRFLEARCCANLAPISISLGRLDRAGHMIQRVEQLGAQGEASPQQLWQIRNTNIYRLRFMGELAEALQLGTPLPEMTHDGSRHFRGWCALSTAMAAVDADQFELAERAWQQADKLIDGIDDNNLSRAELYWERAWLRLRQDRLEEAHADIRVALRLVESGMDTEHVHALVVAAVIDLARDDLALVSRYLREASDRFRAVDHRLGLASVLLHIAVYHLRGHRPIQARLMLAEGLALLRRFRAYGSYYWLPSTMVELCRIAMEEDWIDESQTLMLRPIVTDEQAPSSDLYELDSHPRDVLGEFAAQLAARRLAERYWRAFAPLLSDHRPQVRRRAAQVLLAASDDEAYNQVMALRSDPSLEIQAWLMKYQR